MRALMISIASWAILASQAVHAQDLEGVWFVGGAVSDSSNAYGGIVQALPGSRLGDGLAVRAAVTGGRYRYDADDANIVGKYLGGEIAVVMQKSGEWGWANFSLGPRVTDTSLSPGDPSNDRSGTRFDLGLQSDGTFKFGTFRTHWYGAFGPADKTYNGRVQLGRVLQNERYELGIDGRLVGDPSFAQQTLGGYLVAPLTDAINVELGSGIVWNDANEKDAYASVSFSSVF